MTVDTGYTPLEDIEYTWQWKEDLCQRLEDSVQHMTVDSGFTPEVRGRVPMKEEKREG